MLAEVTLSNNRDAFIFKSQAPNGVTINIPEVLLTKSFDADTAITITVAIAEGVAGSLIAAWLYDKFKECRSNQITINRREIHMNNGEVSKIIEESIKI